MKNREGEPNEMRYARHYMPQLNRKGRFNGVNPVQLGREDGASVGERFRRDVFYSC